MGDRYTIDGWGEWVIHYTSLGVALLRTNGRGWTEDVRVADRYNLTINDFKKMFSYLDWKKIYATRVPYQGKIS